MNTSTKVAETDRLRDQASQQIQSSRLDGAQATLESLLRIAPHDIRACLQLADLMFKRGQVRASSQPLLHAAQRLPRHMPLVLHLAQNLTARGEIVTARRCLDFLSQAPDPPADLLLTLARARFALGEIVLAKDVMERALQAGADNPDDHYLYAMLLQFTGDIDGACAVFEQCLERWPDFAEAMVALVNMRQQSAEVNRLAFVDEQLRGFTQHTDDLTRKFIHAEFEYARFKILDNLRRPDAAWLALARCNALMHELNPYATQDESALIDALVDTPHVIGSTDTSASGFDGPVPIFIVGMARSGTTLLDRMLSSHSQVTSAGELIEFWRQLHWVANERPAKTHSLRRIIARSADIDFREVGARYLQQTQWRAGGHGYYIDKLPANIQMVAFIRRALPHAPILHMQRDPMDVCFSNFKAFFGNDTCAYSYDLQALAHYYRGYARLCAHWHAQAPGAMLDVPYASLISDPEATMRTVLAHCGLDIEEACLHPERNSAPVATPSSAQVREPIHNRSIGEWRNYAAQLEPLRTALG